MFTFNVDLGQLIISGLLAAIGWFSIQTVRRIESKLEAHDNRIGGIERQISFIIGKVGRRHEVKALFEGDDEN